jgi:hypothetical protein
MDPESRLIAVFRPRLTDRTRRRNAKRVFLALRGWNPRATLGLAGNFLHFIFSELREPPLRLGITQPFAPALQAGKGSGNCEAVNFHRALPAWARFCCRRFQCHSAMAEKRRGAMNMVITRPSMAAKEGSAIGFITSAAWEGGRRWRGVTGRSERTLAIPQCGFTLQHLARDASILEPDHASRDAERRGYGDRPEKYGDGPLKDGDGYKMHGDPGRDHGDA